MKICTFNNDIEIDINIGNLKLETINYGGWKDGKSTSYSELHLWYDNNCGYCACSWEDRGCEGEYIDCGCCLAKKGQEEAPRIICMLPNCIKNLLLKIKFKKVRE